MQHRNRSASGSTMCSAVPPTDHCSGVGFHFHWASDKSVDGEEFLSGIVEPLQELSPFLKSEMRIGGTERTIYPPGAG